MLIGNNTQPILTTATIIIIDMQVRPYNNNNFETKQRNGERKWMGQRRQKEKEQLSSFKPQPIFALFTPIFFSSAYELYEDLHAAKMSVRMWGHANTLIENKL